MKTKIETFQPRGEASGIEDMVRPSGREMDSWAVEKMSQHDEQRCLVLLPENDWEQRAHQRTKRVFGESLPRPLCLAAAAVKVDWRMVGDADADAERRGEGMGAQNEPCRVERGPISANTRHNGFESG